MNNTTLKEIDKPVLTPRQQAIADKMEKQEAYLQTFDELTSIGWSEDDAYQYLDCKGK